MPTTAAGIRTGEVRSLLAADGAVRAQTGLLGVFGVLAVAGDAGEWGVLGASVLTFFLPVRTGRLLVGVA